HRNFAIDLGFYPLGSCTMKYNPKIAEVAAALPGFARLHPAQPPAQTQGALPGLLIMRAYHEAAGNPRRRVVIPDSAHGTNPASVRLAGFEVTTVRSGADGLVDLDALEAGLDTRVAGLLIP